MTVSETIFKLPAHTSIVFPLCYWARSQQAAGQKGAALLPKNLPETPTPETCEPQPYSLGVISPL